MRILADVVPAPRDTGTDAGAAWLVIAMAVIAVVVLTIGLVIRHNRRSARKP